MSQRQRVRSPKRSRLATLSRPAERPHAKPASAVCGLVLGGGVPRDSEAVVHRGDSSGGGQRRVLELDRGPILPPARGDGPSAEISRLTLYPTSYPDAHLQSAPPAFSC
jgi:hypothetical protein